MWKSLFDWFVEFFSGISWSQLLAQHSEDAEGVLKLRSIFRNDLYPLAGILFLIMTSASAFIYYYVFNRKGGSGYGFKVRFWLMFWTLTAVVVGVVMLWICVGNTKPYTVFNPFKFSLALSIATTLYSALLFFILSLFLKLGSVANRTPF